MNQLAKSFLFVGILVIVASPAFAVLTVSHLTDADLPTVFTSQQHVGEGRAGDGTATATYEVGVGGTMGAPTVTGQYTWITNTKVPFFIDYNATTDIVTFSIDGVFVQETIVLSGTTEILLRVATPSKKYTMSLENMFVDGEAVIELGSASESHDILWISGATIADGFVVTGDVKAKWSNAEPAPVGDQVSFSVVMGNTSTVPTEETTWGMIKALYN
ncbi:MAG: hypothetical protein IH969_02530 [Candidatus Krumholzibacteriota bacterium]|nr:hypothetical protein [Candidatus Krumholzibacteriota bacterium]